MNSQSAPSSNPSQALERSPSAPRSAWYYSVILAVHQIRAGRLVDLPVEGLGMPLQAPAAWAALAVPPSDIEATLTRSSVSAIQPVFLVDLHAPGDGGVGAVLEKAVGEALVTVPDFEIYNGPESWQRHFDGALALDFYYSQPQPNGGSAPMIGTLALLPLDEGPVVGLCLLSSLHDFQARRWDVIRMAQALRSADKPPRLPIDRSLNSQASLIP